MLTPRRHSGLVTESMTLQRRKFRPFAMVAALSAAGAALFSWAATGCVNLSALEGGLTATDANILDTSPPTDGGDERDAGDSGDSCMLLDGSVCTSIPRLNGVQTLDGIGDEFCAIPATEFVVANGAAADGLNQGIDTLVKLRGAWSAVGLHFHIHVEQAVVLAADASALYYGDAIEILTTPLSPPTGSMGPGADPGIHIVVSPPSGNQTAALGSVVYTTLAQNNGHLDPSAFAARLVPGGYEVEVLLTWDMVQGKGNPVVPPPSGGSRIGFDFACDIRATNGGRKFQSWYYAAAVPANVPSDCSIASYRPYCDDRMWCFPVLEP